MIVLSFVTPGKSPEILYAVLIVQTVVLNFRCRSQSLLIYKCFLGLINSIIFMGISFCTEWFDQGFGWSHWQEEGGALSRWPVFVFVVPWPLDSSCAKRHWTAAVFLILTLRFLPFSLQDANSGGRNGHLEGVPASPRSAAECHQHCGEGRAAAEGKYPRGEECYPPFLHICHNLHIVKFTNGLIQLLKS